MNSLFVFGVLVGTVSILGCVIYLVILNRQKKKVKNRTKNEITVVGVSHITPAGANIFLELGFPPDEAKLLLEDSNMKIEAKRKSAKNDVF